MVKKRLVIDASIATACCAENAISMHPTPERCRNFLMAVQSCQHSVVITPDIQVEWENHKSRFFTEWLARMTLRGKCVVIKSSPINQDLRDSIEKLAKNDFELAIMNKDILLLEAALVTDNLVASRDEKARRPFAVCAQNIPKIQNIVWVNPDEPEEKAIEWLREGAPADDFRMLGYVE
jgi:hypothetical protein